MAETILSRDLKDNKNKDKAVGAHLRDMVKNMIRIAREEYTELNPEVEEGMIPRPLIRVKVEYSGGFTTYNPQQFGREFVGQVANPKDILLFYRKRVFSKEGNEMKADTKAQPTVPISIPTHLEEGAKMEDLVQEYLDAQELKILPENQLMEAVGIFVDKDDKEAIKEFVSMSLERSRAMLSNLDIDGDDVDMAEEAESVKKKLAKDFMETGVPLVVNTKKSAAAGTGKSTGGRKKKDSDSESEEEVVVKKKKAPAKPAAKPRATKAKPKKKVVSEDEEIDESEEEVKPKKSSAKGKQRAESVEEDMFEDEEDDVIPASRPVRSGVSVKAGGSRKLPFGGGLKRKVESGGEGAAKKKGRQSSIVGFVKREDDDDE
jgi:double-strand break repair protein MRE11